MIAASILAATTALLALGGHTRARSRPTTTVNEPVTRLGALRTVSARHRAALWTAGAFIATLAVGPLLALALVLGALGWPRLRNVLAERARRRSIEVAWPEAVEMLILVVHAGLTPHQSIEMLAELAPAPTRPGFAEVCRRTARGAPLADALAGLVDELGAGATSVADTLAMAERYGTPITVALEQLAVDVRERRRRQAEADARQLPIRMSFPLVTCTLPSFVLVAIVPAVLASLSSLSGGF